MLAGDRTRLTGLTADEAEALFLAAPPGPAAQLGLGPVLATAQLKVRAALPAGRWYVVAGPGPRTFRVDQILELATSDEEFTRPDDFDLAAYWTAYQRDFHRALYRAEAVVQLAPGTRLGGPADLAVRDNGRVQDDGWTLATVPIESVDHAHAEFLRLGTGGEVPAPAEPRDRIARTVAELARIHGNSRPPGGD
ncbi:WYL domain-containing protein [Streptomyces spinoverrucosus]|nr:WYL domain-containing protein [Streptomyces spinoverrucosus]